MHLPTKMGSHCLDNHGHIPFKVFPSRLKAPTGDPRRFPTQEAGDRGVAHQRSSAGGTLGPIDLADWECPCESGVGTGVLSFLVSFLVVFPFWCSFFWRFLVYLVVQSPGKLIYFPKRTPMVGVTQLTLEFLDCLLRVKA